jgi:hypothetical protein
MFVQVNQRLAFFTLLVVSVSGARALRADYVYSDFSGTTISFSSLNETSPSSDPFFGQPAPTGDTAIAPGTGFLVSSANGGLDVASARLQMTISALPGNQIESLTIRVVGSYFGFGTSATSAAHTSAIAQTGDGTWSDNMVVFNQGTGSGVHDNQFTLSFPATGTVNLSLDHLLLAASGFMEAAFIDSSSIQIGILTSFAVPEPGLMAIFGIFLALVVFPRRNRRVPVR